MYHLMTAACMHVMQWLCPDIINAVQRLVRHMTVHRKADVQALMMLMEYIVSTVNRGLVPSPKERWSRKHKFKMHRHQMKTTPQIPIIAEAFLVGQYPSMEP